MAEKKPRAAAEELTISLFGPDIKKVGNLRPFLEKVAQYLQGQYILAFQRQGRKTKWLPRSVPNIAGIISDIKKGGRIRSRRYSNRPALIDTGRLRNSGATRILGDKIIWGTNVPYAGLHQYGGISEIENPIPKLLKRGDKRVKQEMKKLEKKFPDKADMLMYTKRFVIKVPARPFLEITDEDILQFQDALDMHLKGEA